MSEPALDLIPTEIVGAYYPDGITRQAAIKGGEINTTLLVVDTKGEKTILQRLSNIYDTSVGEDYEVVAAHLRGEGWEMATTLKASDGTSYLPDSSGRLWRAFNYIESTPGSELEGDLEACAALGGLLGALHHSLVALDYQPKFSRPHAQDADYHSSRLEVLIPKIPDPANRELAGKMIALSREVTISSEPTQLIHSDPRIGNTLFRSGEPFTFIDWDGFRKANPLVDIGDMLQSTVGEVITKGSGSCSVEQLYPMLEAYYAQAGLSTDRQAFIEKAMAAGRIIALNLGMRHLIDSVEDRYFVWDTTQFKSRLEFNLFCAQRQQQVYKALEA
jgi:Ser/Thr protein kinase RdoA (MazF antagonist)